MSSPVSGSRAGEAQRTCMALWIVNSIMLPSAPRLSDASVVGLANCAARRRMTVLKYSGVFCQVSAGGIMLPDEAASRLNVTMPAGLVIGRKEACGLAGDGSVFHEAGAVAPCIA